MLLDEILPTYHFNEIHTKVIQAPAERIYQAIKESKASDIPLLKPLFWLRGLPAKLTGKAEPAFTDEPLLPQMYQKGFAILAEIPNQEFVFGLISRPWQLTDSQSHSITNLADFVDFMQPSYVKVAVNFCLESPAGGNQVKVTTETRILATDPDTRRKFARYWAVIYPGSALLRRTWLWSIKRQVEQGNQVKVSSQS